MKRIILTAVAVFALSFANAQEVKFGFKGGLNSSNISISGDASAPSTSSRIGFTIGSFVEFKVSEKFAIQPELLYSTQGAKFDLVVSQNGTDFDTKNTFKLGYVNIPVLFKYYAAKNFSLEAGPQIGFLVDSKLETKVLGQSITQDADKIFKTVDFGLNLGAGYDFSNHVFAALRYSIGLSNIAKNSSGDEKMTNKTFSVSLGYKF